jgi:ribulose-phosphate 3-epimerase
LSEIIPAIIAKSFKELEEKIKLVESFVRWVQLDIMDGKFVSEKTWDEPEELKKISTKLNIEVHLMVEDAVREVERWAGSGVKRILAHWEALENSKVKNQNSKVQFKIQNLIDICEKAGVELGLVLNLDTPTNILDEFTSIISYKLSVIQLMSIAKIGYHGHPFDERVIHKVELLRQKWPDVKISLDGGINEEIIKKTALVGVDNFVVGSAIFNSKNIKESIEELESIINN